MQLLRAKHVWRAPGELFSWRGAAIGACLKLDRDQVVVVSSVSLAVDSILNLLNPRRQQLPIVPDRSLAVEALKEYVTLYLFQLGKALKLSRRQLLIGSEVLVVGGLVLEERAVSVPQCELLTCEVC